MNRRRFIKSGAIAGALFQATPHLIAQAPGRKFKTALIGSGWWGKNILKEAMASGRCKVVGLCDVDGRALDVAGEQVNDLSGDQPKAYKDYRSLLSEQKPDVVIISTPDHWHSLQSIAALKAGAHVFVEKPSGHTINESKAMLNAARAVDRVVQVGLHRRIGPHFVSAHRFLKEGRVGKIGMVRLFVSGGGGAEKPVANSPAPDGMDWDMWCGPAPMRPFNTKLHPGGWRNFLDYGNGQIGDWGVHWIDQVYQWTDEKYPKRVYSTGSRNIRGPSVMDDRGQTSDAPDTQVAVFDFESFTVTWEHRQYAENPTEKHRIGAYFYGTNGVLHIGWRDGWTFHPANENGETIHEDAQIQEPDGHNLKLLWADFMDAIDQRRRPVADIELAHRSTTTVLLGMMSYKLGRSVNWDGAAERVIGDEGANALLARKYRGSWEYPEI